MATYQTRSSDEPAKTMSVRLDESLHSALEMTSTATGKSMNLLVNEAVRSYVSSDSVIEAMQDQQSRYQEAIDRLSGGNP